MTAVLPERPARLLPDADGDNPPAAPLTALAFPGRIGISPEEFADATGTGRTLVYQRLQSGEIPHKRLGRRYVIPLVALDRWLAEAQP